MNMKILHVGIFKDHELGGDIVLKKGFSQNNCTVYCFDYRAISSEHGVDKMISMLRDLASSDIDMLFIGKGELLTRELLCEIKNKGVTIALWYGDIRVEPEHWLLNLLPEVDFFFMTSGGDKLKEYFEKGRCKVAAYFFNPSDPDLVDKYCELPRCTRDVVFTGSYYDFAGHERKQVIQYLKARNDVTFYGGGEYNAKSFVSRIKNKFVRCSNASPCIRGVDYIAAIKSAKIGIGVSAYQNVPRYTSDRLTHYLAFGTFYLLWDFPEVYSLFDVGNEIITFKGTEDLASKIMYYLKNIDERESIAKAGQARVLIDYSCKNIVGMMLDIINTGNSVRFPWIEVYK